MVATGSFWGVGITILILFTVCSNSRTSNQNRASSVREASLHPQSHDTNRYVAQERRPEYKFFVGIDYQIGEEVWIDAYEWFGKHIAESVIESINEYDDYADLDDMGDIEDYLSPEWVDDNGNFRYE